MVPLVERVLSDLLEDALAPFREEGFEVTHGPSRLHGADEFLFDELKRHGLSMPAGAEPRTVWTSFRVGDLDEHEFGIGVVPLLGDADPEVALVLSDPWGTHPEPSRLLLLPPEEVREREVRRWMERWFARMLVDYAQRL